MTTRYYFGHKWGTVGKYAKKKSTEICPMKKQPSLGFFINDYLILSEHFFKIKLWDQIFFHCKFMGVLLSVIFLMNTCLLWIVSGGTNTPNFILRCLQPISLYETEEIQNTQVLKYLFLQYNGYGGRGVNMANNEGWGNSQLYQKSTKLVVFCWMLWFVWDASCQEVIIQEGDVIWGRAMNNYFNLFLSKYHDIIMKVGRWEAISFVNCKILKHAFVLFSNNNIE